jgi:hypothetical protein
VTEQGERGRQCATVARCPVLIPCGPETACVGGVQPLGAVTVSLALAEPTRHSDDYSLFALRVRVKSVCKRERSLCTGADATVCSPRVRVVSA